MSWYTISKSFILDQTLNLIPPEFSCSLPKSKKIMEDLSMEDILKNFADEKGYRSALDYVLCSLYPELEKECREYYSRPILENSLKNRHPPKYIKRVDDIVGKGILAFYTKYVQITDQPEGDKK